MLCKIHNISITDNPNITYILKDISDKNNVVSNLTGNVHVMYFKIHFWCGEVLVVTDYPTPR